MSEIACSYDSESIGGNIRCQQEIHQRFKRNEASGKCPQSLPLPAISGSFAYMVEINPDIKRGHASP
jgi:hypothetical protein